MLELIKETIINQDVGVMDIINLMTIILLNNDKKNYNIHLELVMTSLLLIRDFNFGTYGNFSKFIFYDFKV